MASVTPTSWPSSRSTASSPLEAASSTGTRRWRSPPRRRVPAGRRRCAAPAGVEDVGRAGGRALRAAHPARAPPTQPAGTQSRRRQPDELDALGQAAGGDDASVLRQWPALLGGDGGSLPSTRSRPGRPRTPPRLNGCAADGRPRGPWGYDRRWCRWSWSGYGSRSRPTRRWCCCASRRPPAPPADLHRNAGGDVDPLRPGRA